MEECGQPVTWTYHLESLEALQWALECERNRAACARTLAEKLQLEKKTIAEELVEQRRLVRELQRQLRDQSRDASSRLVFAAQQRGKRARDEAMELELT